MAIDFVEGLLCAPLQKSICKYSNLSWLDFKQLLHFHQNIHKEQRKHFKCFPCCKALTTNCFRAPVESISFWNDSKRGFVKGLAGQFFGRPWLCEKHHFWGHWTSSVQSQKSLIKSHVKHATTKLHAKSVQKTFPSYASSSHRHGISI